MWEKFWIENNKIPWKEKLLLIELLRSEQEDLRNEISHDQKPSELKSPVIKISAAETTWLHHQNIDHLKDFIITPQDTEQLLKVLNTKNVKDFSTNLHWRLRERFPKMAEDMIYARQKYNGRSWSQDEYYSYEVLSRGLSIVVPALKLKLDQILLKQWYTSIQAYAQDVQRLQPDIEGYMKVSKKIDQFELEKKTLLNKYYAWDQNKANKESKIVQDNIQQLLRIQQHTEKVSDPNQQAELQIKYIQTLNTIPKDWLRYVQQLILKQEQSNIGSWYQKLQSYQSRNSEFAKVFAMAEQLRSSWIMNCLSNCEKTTQNLQLTNEDYLPGVKKDLLNTQKKQQEADAFWLTLKSTNMITYTTLNTVSGVWKGLIDASISTLYKWAAMLWSVAWWWSKGHTLWVLARGDDLIDAITPDLSQAMSAWLVDQDDNLILNLDNIPQQLGSWLAQMFVLIYGGGVITTWLKAWALKAWITASEWLLSSTWLFTSSMLQQVPRSYEIGVKSWLNSSEAFVYAMVMGTAQSSLELISPNKLFSGEFMSTLKSINWVSAQAVKKQLIKQLTVKLAREVRDENIQEQLQGIAEIALNMWTMELLRNHATLDTKLTLNDIIATSVMTTMITGIASGGWVIVYNNVDADTDRVVQQNKMAELLKVMKFGDFANLYLSKDILRIAKLQKLKTYIQSITDYTPSQKELYDSILKQIEARLTGNDAIVDENNAIIHQIYQSTKADNSSTTDKLGLDPTNTDLISHYETMMGRELTPRHIQAIVDAHEIGSMDELNNSELYIKALILKWEFIVIRNDDGKAILSKDGKVQTKQISPVRLSTWYDVLSEAIGNDELFKPQERRFLIEMGFTGKSREEIKAKQDIADANTKEAQINKDKYLDEKISKFNKQLSLQNEFQVLLDQFNNERDVYFDSYEQIESVLLSLKSIKDSPSNQTINRWNSQDPSWWTDTTNLNNLYKDLSDRLLDEETRVLKEFKSQISNLKTELDQISSLVTTWTIQSQIDSLPKTLEEFEQMNNLFKQTIQKYKTIIHWDAKIESWASSSDINILVNIERSLMKLSILYLLKDWKKVVIPSNREIFATEKEWSIITKIGRLWSLKEGKFFPSKELKEYIWWIYDDDWKLQQKHSEKSWIDPTINISEENESIGVNINALAEQLVYKFNLEKLAKSMYDAWELLWWKNITWVVEWAIDQVDKSMWKDALEDLYSKMIKNVIPEFIDLPKGPKYKSQNVEFMKDVENIKYTQAVQRLIEQTFDLFYKSVKDGMYQKDTLWNILVDGNWNMLFNSDLSKILKNAENTKRLKKFIEWIKTNWEKDSSILEPLISDSPVERWNVREFAWNNIILEVKLHEFFNLHDVIRDYDRNTMEWLKKAQDDFNSLEDIFNGLEKFKDSNLDGKIQIYPIDISNPEYHTIWANQLYDRLKSDLDASKITLKNNTKLKEDQNYIDTNQVFNRGKDKFAQWFINLSVRLEQRKWNLHITNVRENDPIKRQLENDLYAWLGDPDIQKFRADVSNVSLASDISPYWLSRSIRDEFINWIFSNHSASHFIIEHIDSLLNVPGGSPNIAKLREKLTWSDKKSLIDRFKSLVSELHNKEKATSVGLVDLDSIVDNENLWNQKNQNEHRIKEIGKIRDQYKGEQRGVSSADHIRNIINLLRFEWQLKKSWLILDDAQKAAIIDANNFILDQVNRNIIQSSSALSLWYWLNWLRAQTWADRSDAIRFILAQDKPKGISTVLRSKTLLSLAIGWDLMSTKAYLTSRDFGEKWEWVVSWLRGIASAFLPRFFTPKERKDNITPDKKWVIAWLFTGALKIDLIRNYLTYQGIALLLTMFTWLGGDEDEQKRIDYDSGLMDDIETIGVITFITSRFSAAAIVSAITQTLSMVDDVNKLAQEYIEEKYGDVHDQINTLALSQDQKDQAWTIIADHWTHNQHEWIKSSWLSPIQIYSLTQISEGWINPHEKLGSFIVNDYPKIEKLFEIIWNNQDFIMKQLSIEWEMLVKITKWIRLDVLQEKLNWNSINGSTLKDKIKELSSDAISESDKINYLAYIAGMMIGEYKTQQRQYLNSQEQTPSTQVIENSQDLDIVKEINALYQSNPSFKLELLELTNGDFTWTRASGQKNDQIKALFKKYKQE